MQNYTHMAWDFIVLTLPNPSLISSFVNATIINLLSYDDIDGNSIFPNLTLKSIFSLNFATKNSFTFLLTIFRSSHDFCWRRLMSLSSLIKFFYYRVWKNIIEIKKKVKRESSRLTCLICFQLSLLFDNLIF